MKQSLLFIALLIVLTSTGVSFAGQLSDEQTRKIAASLDSDDATLDAASPIIADPLEGFNRAMFTFNDVFINYAARPAYDGYSYITPGFFREGVSNFFHNLLFPVRFTNNLLQGNGRAAGVEMSRFVLNTTAGLGGFINVAKNHKTVVPVNYDADFGQTLGVWGVGEGFYLVWPILGSSTARDTVGHVGDYFLDPISYTKSAYFSMGLKAGRTFNDLDKVLDLYDDLTRSSVEPYSSMRDAFVQFRRAKIADGKQ